jgi:preprotein translocase subunit SecD
MIKTKITAFLVLLVTFGIGFFVYSNEPSLSKREGEVKYPFHLGLDLAGGTQITYRADVSELEQEEVSDAMDILKTVIERRVNPLGQEETNIQIQEASFANEGEYRIIIELPGVTDIGEAKKQIGETPILEFKLLRTDVDFETLDPETVNFDDMYVATELTGRYLESSELQFAPSASGTYGAGSQTMVVLKFNDEGEALFSKITRENVGRELAIFLDGVPISNPIIREEITGGEAVISGDFTPDEGKALAQQLNFGALPVPIEEIGTQTIGASLGYEAIDAGIKAGLLGLMVLALYFLLWYRMTGLIAVFALFVYGIIMFALIKVIPITLTASGIAGFIISLGVAVDANVLISERLREELKSGKTIQEGIKEGFDRAWLSIRDSNISGLIIAVILFWFGSNLIKGFAMTLGLGIIVSMFSAITLTKVFLLAAAGKSNSKRMRFLFSSGFKK